MTVSEVLDEPSSIDYPFEEPSNGLWERVASLFFKIASYLTDPICYAHEFYRRLFVVDALNPTSSAVANLARKFFLFLGVVAWATLSLFTTLTGIGLRALASCLQKNPFIYVEGESPNKTLSADRSFTVLSWNICGPGGGYPISDGGVMPWSFRIDDIVDKIIQKDADVNCLYETIDSKSAFILCEKLKEKGYRHFYFNMGAQAFGVSSGIFVASKYKIREAVFTPFPNDSLVGRTKYAAKGVFAFDLQSEENSFARIFATHLQHSEEVEFPTEEEISGRKKQMQIIIDLINQVRNRCVLVTGDLNLDDLEYNASSWHYLFQKNDLFNKKTWGGDEFCALLMNKRPSGPCNLDHTMLLNGTAQAFETTLLETGYDPTVFKPEALSDHEGLFTKVYL